MDRLDPYLRLHHIPVFVRDHDRSLRFFVDQLGFSLVIDYRFGEGGRFILVAPPDGTALLALIVPMPESEESKLIGSSRWVVFVTEDVTAQFQVWLDRGVHFRYAPRSETRGGTFASFEDVDGNEFVLAGWDDITRSIEMRRRAAAEQQESERRAAREREIAAEVQAKLLPQAAPPLETLEYAGLCIQAREVGGDYYDFLNLGPARLGLVIGDIAGKGIAAALLMANLQANLRSQSAFSSDEPWRLLQSVNRLFYENTTDSAYATLFFLEYDDRTRRFRYANCGHVTALLLRRDGTLQRLESTATVLGLFEEWDCPIEQQSLSPGDLLLLYTDGITESFNAAGEEFGESRLIECLQRHRGLTPSDLLAEIAAEVRRFSPHEQHDDLTLLVAKGRAGDNGIA